MYNDTDEGVRKYFSGKVEWEKAHIPGSVFVNILTEIYGQDPHDHTQCHHRDNLRQLWNQ